MCTRHHEPSEDRFSRLYVCGVLPVHDRPWPDKIYERLKGEPARTFHGWVYGERMAPLIFVPPVAPSRQAASQ